MVRLDSEISIVIAGSAASVLREEITRDANDCDIVEVLPISAEHIVINAGMNVSGALNFNQNWLNAECMSWKNDFPQGWNERCTQYCTYDNLTVLLMSQLDCVVMMLIRFLSPDKISENALADIKEIGLTKEEMQSVQQHITNIGQKNDWDTSRLITFFS